MMGWWGGGGWAMMSIGMVLFWGLLIAGIVALIRATRIGGEGRPEQSARRTPEQVLAERFARGEIDETEYRRRRDTLDSAGAGSRPVGGR